MKSQKEIEKGIEEKTKLIREEFENVKFQHIKKIKGEYGKLVDVEKQRERDIKADIEKDLNIQVLQTLFNYNQEVIKMIEEIRREYEKVNLKNIELKQKIQNIGVIIACEKIEQKLKGDKQ